MGYKYDDNNEDNELFDPFEKDDLKEKQLVIDAFCEYYTPAKDEDTKAEYLTNTEIKSLMNGVIKIDDDELVSLLDKKGFKMKMQVDDGDFIGLKWFVNRIATKSP